MNFRYEYSEENKSLLQSFIKKAEQCKSNPYCNLQEHYKLSKIFPMANIEKYIDNNEIINISDSDEDNLHETNLLGSDQSMHESLKPLEETGADIIFAIKETLKTEKCLTSHVISDLHNCNLNINDIFKQLFIELNSEEVIHFGVSLRSNCVSNNNIIVAYVKHLLIMKLILEYSEQYQQNFNQFCEKYPEIISDELSNYLLNSDNYSRVELQYIDGSPINFKSSLLRNILTNCKNLEENHISLYDILLGDIVEHDSLNKLIGIMSNSADNYATNKTFGKFLLKVIQLIGKQFFALEKPMSHIIGTHKSIWKSKVKKIYDELIQDSISMSQSLMY